MGLFPYKFKRQTWRSPQPPSSRSSRRGRKSSLVIKVTDTTSCPVTGVSLKVLITECEDVSRECMLCPTLVSAQPKTLGTCSLLDSEKYLYTMLRNSKS